MIKDNYVRRLTKIHRVIDGDTIEAWMDKGDGDLKFVTIRFLGIDTPERWEYGYHEAKEYVEEALADNPTVYIQAIEKKENDLIFFKKGGFERLLATIYVGEDEDQYNLNERLLEKGLAEVYRR